MLTVILIGLSLASTPVPGNCFSYLAENPCWEDISHGQLFWWVATHPSSDAIWAVKKTKFGDGDRDGWQIVSYDRERGVWNSDPTQPVGSSWSGLSVDANGFPVIVQRNSYW